MAPGGVGPRVYYVSAHGVGVECPGGDTLEVRVSPGGGVRLVRNWRPASTATPRELLALVEAMARALQEWAYNSSA